MSDLYNPAAMFERLLQRTIEDYDAAIQLAAFASDYADQWLKAHKEQIESEIEKKMEAALAEKLDDMVMHHVSRLKIAQKERFEE